jgi:hypothetical protein
MERVIDRDAKTYREDVISADDGRVLYTSRQTTSLTPTITVVLAIDRRQPKQMMLPSAESGPVSQLERAVWIVRCPTHPAVGGTLGR